MHRIILPALLALASLFAAGTITPSLPAAHAQAVPAYVTPAQTVVSAGNSITIYGRCFTPNNWAYVYLQRPDRTTNAVSIPTSNAGTFTLTLEFNAAHGAGDEFVSAYDYGTRRWTPSITVSVVNGVPNQARLIAVSSTSVIPGQTITVSGQAFNPNNWVYVSFRRPDGTTGSFWAQTGPNGNFASQLGFDSRHGCGVETVWAYDYAAAAWSAPVTVTVTGCGSQTVAPSNLRIVSVARTQSAPEGTVVTLQWQDNSSGEAGFRIHTTLTRLYGGTDNQVQDVGPNTTSTAVTFAAGGINPVKTACFTVTALVAGNETAPSNQVCTQL